MKVLIWHVHGAWMTSFVQGPHESLVPIVADRGPHGRGRAQTYAWPERAVERTPDALASSEIDVVVIQRREEIALCDAWLGGRRVGRDLPLVWVEHNAPQGRIDEMRHPAADCGREATVVHVSHANALLWDTGPVPSVVIEHGIVDPGSRYSGLVPRAAVAINEPLRRGRVCGVDLLPRFAAVGGLDLFGIASERMEGLIPGLRAFGDVPHDLLLEQMARRRVYLHPYRWTSLGIALIEAMHLAMPVVVVASLEAGVVVPGDAGVVSNRVEVLVEGLRTLIAEPDEARRRGERARAYALERHGIGRFVDDWSGLLKEVTA
jgi:hypothetical protein